MNRCERYELLVSLVIDEEATLEEQAELEIHLESCPDCQAYFADMKRLHEVLSPEKIILPEGFAVRVMDRVRETAQDQPEEKKVIPFPHWRRWAALAACCAIAVLSVWSFRGMGAKDVISADDAARTAMDARSMPQEAAMQSENADAIKDGISVLSEAPPPMPEEYGAKSAAKEEIAESMYQLPVNDEAESEEDAGGSLEAMPSVLDMPEFTLNGAGEDTSVYDYERESADTPTNMEADPSLADVDRLEELETPAPAPIEPTSGPEQTDVAPVEVINAPEEGVLIAFSGGAAQEWVENVLGQEWASGGSYTLSVDQYSDLLGVLEETGEPYSIEPGEGYCLMTG